MAPLTDDLTQALGPTDHLLTYHLNEIGEKGWCFADLGSRNIVHVIIWMNHGVDSDMKR